MAPSQFKQDLPPAGGYARLVYERIPPKKIFGPVSLVTGYLAITAMGYYLFARNKKKLRKERLELRDAKIALEPFLLAERDRAFLKQLSRNRDEEAELMKDVPGWKVGTWYGEPIYKTLPDDYWLDPILDEYYAHSSRGSVHSKAFFHWYH